jgi:hypothetical protein
MGFRLPLDFARDVSRGGEPAEPLRFARNDGTGLQERRLLLGRRIGRSRSSRHSLRHFVFGRFVCARNDGGGLQ